jgi:hypothetical protein
VLWLVPGQRPPVVQATPPEVSTAPLQNVTNTTATPDRDEGKRLQQEESDNAIVRAIEQTNVPINFWGRVVDQDQQPIGGARVQYSYSTEHSNGLTVAWGQQKIHKNEITTDAAGMFTVSGFKGHTLTVESLVKEGYDYASRGVRVYNYYGNSPSGRFTPEPTNPVVFVMMHKAAGEQLISYGGDFGKTMRLPGNGTPTRWSLWKGRADPNGELQLTFKREPSFLERVGQPVTWSAQVGLVGGGIVQASPDESFYRAPEDGYVLELDYPKVEQKRGIPARSFYIKTADGKYGRIEVHLYADDEGPTARCLIKAVMNPSGSRVLESGSSSTSSPR